jgi:Uma2 family endonuclease
MELAMPTLTLKRPRVLTVKQFARLPDEARGYELVNGRLETIKVSTRSSYYGLEFGAWIREFVRIHKLGWVLGSDQNYQCFGHGKTVRKADASFIHKSRMSIAEYEADGFCPIVPDLVVEVTSPRDLLSKVERKMQMWIDVGVKLAWLVKPETKSVTVYTAGQRPMILVESDMLTGDPVLPGFAVPLTDVFALPK